MNLDTIGSRSLKGVGSSTEEGIFLSSGKCPLPDLMAWAGKIRERFFNKTVQFCVIVNARSGSCSEDCRFCAQSARYATGADTYPLLTSDELVRAADDVQDSGANSLGIVTSGPATKLQEVETIGSAIHIISAQTGFAPCASLGKLNKEQMRFLKTQGLRRYHHNLETSRSFFPAICSTHTWDERLETVRVAKNTGLEVCSGGLFGMGETWEDRISLALTLRKLGVDSVPINFLNPIPGTPLESRQRLSSEESLRIIALYRFLLPKTMIRVCGGRLTTLGVRQKEMFQAGANAILTGNYLTTNGADPAEDRRMVKELGLKLDA